MTLCVTAIQSLSQASDFDDVLELFCVALHVNSPGISWPVLFSSEPMKLKKKSHTNIFYCLLVHNCL